MKNVVSTARALAPKSFAVVVFACFMVVLSPSPASAHSVGGVGTTNYKSEITGVTGGKATKNVSVRIIEAGARLELTNTGSADVVVFGYSGEPYLRVGPAGVFENKNSPAVYLNQSRYGKVTVPDFANANKAPEWVKKNSGNTVRWHDHRAHWMVSDPPQVKQAPNKTHVVQPKWIIPLKIAGSDAAITGTITWIPGPSPLPWIAGAMVITLVLTALFAVLHRNCALLAITVFGFLIFDISYRFAMIRGVQEPMLVVFDRDTTTVVISQMAWVVLLWAGTMAVRKKRDALTVALFGAIPLLIASEFVDLSVFSRSQIPTALSISTTRLLLMCALGTGLAIVGYGVVDFTQRKRSVGETDETPAITVDT